MAEGAPESSEGVSPIPITFLIGAQRSTAESVPIDEAEKTAERTLSGEAARSVASAGPSAGAGMLLTAGTLPSSDQTQEVLSRGIP
jgi:hypothetical protein